MDKYHNQRAAKMRKTKGLNHYTNCLCASLLLLTQSGHSQIEESDTTLQDAAQNIEASDNSKPMFETVALSPEEKILLLKSETAIDELRFKDAALNANTLLESKPLHAEANRLLGIATANTRSTLEGIKQLDHSLSVDEGDAETHYALGVMHLKRAQEVSLLRIRKSIKQSKFHLDRTLALQSEHISARFYLIQILINTPELAGGDEQMARILQEPLAGYSPLLHKIIDSEFALLDDNNLLAEKLLLEAKQSEPHTPVTNSKLAEFYLATENYNEAIKFAHEFLNLNRKWDDSGTASAYQILAKSHVGLGETEQGIINYNLVISNTKNKKLIRRVKKEIKALTSKEV